MSINNYNIDVPIYKVPPLSLMGACGAIAGLYFSETLINTLSSQD